MYLLYKIKCYISPGLDSAKAAAHTQKPEKYTEGPKKARGGVK